MWAAMSRRSSGLSEVTRAPEVPPTKSPLGHGRSASSRLDSLDAFRGLVILIMTFVNYLAGIEGIPPVDIVVERPESILSGQTLADLVSQLPRRGP